MSAKTPAKTPQIRQRDDGRWEGRYELPRRADGRRQQRSVYGHTEKEVKTKLRNAMVRADKGQPVVDERLTVGSYLGHWLEAVEPRVRPKTLAFYRTLTDHWLIPGLGRIKLARLQPGDVSAFLAQLQRDGLSPRTVAHVRAVLRAALSDAERAGDVTRNVAKLANAPRVPKRSPVALPPAEVHRILDAVKDTPLNNLVTAAIYTGMRQGELLGLRWDDVDLERRQLVVGWSLQRLAGATRLVEPKTDHSRRALRLATPALAALADERKRQLEAQLAAGPRWRPTIAGLVFTDGFGRPLTGTTVTHALQRALRAAGLPPMRFHHLRHVFAGLTLAAGVDLATVSHLLGHSSVALTASTYAGILPTLREDATTRLERLLSQSG